MSLSIRRLLPFLVLLTGCGLTSGVRQTAPSASLLQMSGRVHGGQQPVSGATVQLWQVGTTGYGSTPATLGSSVTTLADGSFALTGKYTCPSESTLVYATATGGNPGLAAGTNNNALALMSAVGFCSNLTSSTFLAINEVTTVASVYSFAQFMNSSGGIGTISSSATGLTNAFATFNNLVSSSAGVARTAPAPGTAVSVLPSATINTLANILVPCVNSTGSSSTACSSLFSAVSPATPSTTLAAAVAIALNPGTNQSALFNLSSANAAFQPTLTASPNDWTLSLGYALGAVPSAIALDATGNLWTAAYATGGTTSRINLMSPAGFPASNSPFTSTSISGADGIAIDASNNAWIANYTAGSAAELDLVSGAIQLLNTFTSIGLSGPRGVAIDASKNIWFANYGNSTVTQLSSAYTPTVYSAGGISSPENIAIDTTGNAWVANLGGNLTHIPAPNSGTAAGSPTAYSGGGLSTPSSVAVGASNNLWVTNAGSSEIADLANSGAVISPSAGYSGGGLTASSADAVDGSGNVWIADQTSTAITELNASGTALSPSTGYQGATVSAPLAIAIDASGNIWVGDGKLSTSSTSVTEFVGLATPAPMPLVQGVLSGSIGKRPGTLAISTHSVTSATLGTPYSFTFSASGGSGTYNWSLTSGASQLLAAGLSLNSAGVLSGTPTAVNSYSFTVQVTDPTTSQTASQAYTLVVGGAVQTTCTHDGTANAILHGNYAYLLTGFNPGGHYVDIIGDFQADGSAIISNGHGDINGDQNIASFATGEQSYTWTGYFSVGSADNRGLITASNANTAATGLPSTAIYCFAADSLDSNGIAHSGRMIEADQTGWVVTGLFELQTPANFTTAGVASGYAFGLQGVDGATRNRRGMIGQFSTDSKGDVTAGQLDTAAYTSGQSAATYSAANAVSAAGSGYTVSGNGRGTLTLTVSGQALSFVTYVVNTGELLVMSANAGTSGTTPLLVGKAMQQTASSYTLASLKGSGAYTASGTTDPSSSAFEDNIQIGQITFNGTGGITAVYDQNAGGSINGGLGSASPETATSTYTVTTPGYLNLGGTAGTNYYLYGTDTGFGLSGSSTGIPLYTLYLQTLPAGGLVTNYLTGTFSAGTVFPAAYNTSSSNNLYPLVFDLVTTFANGVASIVQDETSAPGTAGYTQADITVSNTFTVDSTYGATTGRFIITNGSSTSVVGYFVSPTQLILLPQQASKDPLLIQGFHQ